MTEPITRAAEVIHAKWNMHLADARRIAQELNHAGLLARPLPDPEYGLAIDDNGRRVDGISCALQRQAVSLVATGGDGADNALVLLDAREAEALGLWMLAAAQSLRAPSAAPEGDPR